MTWYVTSADVPVNKVFPQLLYLHMHTSEKPPHESVKTFQVHLRVFFNLYVLPCTVFYRHVSVLRSSRRGAETQLQLLLLQCSSSASKPTCRFKRPVVTCWTRRPTTWQKNLTGSSIGSFCFRRSGFVFWETDRKEVWFVVWAERRRPKLLSCFLPCVHAKVRTGAGGEARDDGEVKLRESERSVAGSEGRCVSWRLRESRFTWAFLFS